MDLDAILNVISSVGFPIACVIALAIFCWKMFDKITADQEKREDKLYQEIGECRIVNKQAVETIAQYAQRLEGIQADVKEIKTDITVIKSKIE